MISQAALEIYIKSGMFERHKIKLNLPITIDKKLAETLERTHSENPLLFTYKSIIQLEFILV